VGGLAGCTGNTDGGDGGGDGSGDSDGGGSDDGDGGGDGVSGDLSCTDITSGYDTLDVGERPIIFDFEYPAIFDEPVYMQALNVGTYEGSRSEDDASLDIKVTQIVDPEGSFGEPPEQRTSGTATVFNGEEVEFLGFSSGSVVTWFGELPYQLDGERQTLPVTLELSYSGEESNECGDALREAAESIVDSMEVNSETTLGN
jgi:hypothetical protein